MVDTHFDSDTATMLHHNNPPPDRPPVPALPDEITAWLKVDCDALVARRDQLIQAFDRFSAAHPTIQDEAVQGKAKDFVSQIKAHMKLIESRRKVEKAPYDDAGDTVHGFFVGLNAPLKKAQEVVEQRQTAFARELQAQRAKEAALAAAARAKEAEAAAARAAATLATEDLDVAIAAQADSDKATKLAHAKPAEHSRVYGDTGAASLVERWDFEVTDLMALVRAVAAGAAPIEYLQADLVRLRQAVVRDKVRGIPGLTIAPVTKIRN